MSFRFRALLLEPIRSPDGRITKDSLRLIRFRLVCHDVFQEKTEERGILRVRSGAIGCQNLRLASASVMGSDEPIPEGRYRLGDPDSRRGLNWRSGKPGVYTGSWGRGLGPVWIGIHPSKELATSRRALGIHLDENRDYSPGSAGCIVVDDLPTLVSWFTKGKDWPVWLVVNYGLGSVKTLYPDWMKRDH